MDSDDDFQSFSPPKEPSPRVHHRRLKRLKKSGSKPSRDPLPESFGDPLLVPSSDFEKLEALENDSEIPDSNDSNSVVDPLLVPSSDFEKLEALENDSEIPDSNDSNSVVDPLLVPSSDFEKLEALENGSEIPDSNDSSSVNVPLLVPSSDFEKVEALENGLEIPFSNDSNSAEEFVLSQGSLSQGVHNENEDKMECGFGEEVKKTKRVLEFDDEGKGGFDGNGRVIGEDSEAFGLGKNKEERIGEEDLFAEKDKKRKKKRVRSDGVDESKTNLRGSNKRREEKERKAYLKELHAESQRVLRETRDASFKPIPVVHKPISSVLEKIRKRKLEISKKAMVVNDRSYSYEGDISSRDKAMDLDVSNEERSKETLATVVEKEIVAPSFDGASSLAASNMDECKDAAKQRNDENEENKVSPNEEPTPSFRAPVHDTQDLFDDSEPNNATARPNDEQLDSPLKEDIAPSLLAMDLKFDSALVDDSSSDEEEDNDKENIAPHPCGIADGSSSPKGDPVKNFVDDEAEEEDDSDHDLHRFQENEEDEDTEDLEELNDMIATGYEERPIDDERRNELHQKWLEQQDAAGTDNIMQRLKSGTALRDAFLQEKESETDEDDEEFDDDEAKEDSPPQNSTRVTTRKAKQIILQLLPDKKDAYLSDDDDETHRRHAQRLLIRKEEQTTVVAPADDESSREVFGLIKKLNIVSDNKRKPKALSYFDSVLKGGNSNNSSKSSFLGRVSNHPISSSHRQGSGTVRSFIFGRDDSNSRSSISMSEDSSDTVSGETRPTRNITAKFSSSKAKFSTQTRDAGSEAVSRTSLLEILKRSSSQSKACNRDSTIDLTKSLLAFRVPKKPMKVEGRS